MYNYLKLIFILLMVTIILIISFKVYQSISIMLNNYAEKINLIINYK
jgi:hypothetical protein